MLLLLILSVKVDIVGITFYQTLQVRLSNFYQYYVNQCKMSIAIKIKIKDVFNKWEPCAEGLSILLN